MPKRDSQHWDSRYRKEETPWDVGVPSRDLLEWLAKQSRKGLRMLDVGCGTGINLVEMTQAGHLAVGIDFAPTAIELANQRLTAVGNDRNVTLECADFLHWDADEDTGFDFILDRGCYHCNRDSVANVKQYVAQLKRFLNTDGELLLLTGNSNDPCKAGPPKMEEQELRADLGDDFEILLLEPTHFEEPDGTDGPLAWKVLARKK